MVCILMELKTILRLIVFYLISAPYKYDYIRPFELIVRIEDRFVWVCSDIFYAYLDTLKTGSVDATICVPRQHFV